MAQSVERPTLSSLWGHDLGVMQLSSTSGSTLCPESTGESPSPSPAAHLPLPLLTPLARSLPPSL